MEELFEEYGNTIRISDFDIHYRGVRIDYVRHNNRGGIELWAGNMDTDKYAEELLPEPEELQEILNIVYDNL